MKNKFPLEKLVQKEQEKKNKKAKKQKQNEK
jgi:hypothetical protein